MVVGDFAATADLVVIGSGPGGYVAAIRAAQLGRKVTIIERGSIGGVCLNVGCIPSKALIQAAHHFADSRKPGLFGVTNENTTIDFAATQKWKDEAVVGRLTSGVEGLLKKNKVEIVRGEAHFVDDQTLRVIFDDVYGQTYKFADCIIATGSTPVEIKALPFGERILDSTGALGLQEVPESLVMVGGGYIGMELACAYANLGTKVTILEGLDRVMAAFEEDLARPVLAELKELGVTIITGAKASASRVEGETVTITYEKDGTSVDVSADYCVVTVGRRPNTDDMGLEAIGVDIDERGLVVVDAQGRTNKKHLFAIGDIVAGPPLAHKASYEAKVAAEAACGDKGAAVDYLAIPTVCYTSPEIATVGLTKKEATARGLTVGTAKFPLGANGRSLSMDNQAGFVRLVADKQSGRLLGAQLVGPNVSELTGELALAIENLLTVEDVARTIHAHPTLGESVMDAAEIVLGHPIHQ